jgi:hypothetical protein
MTPQLKSFDDMDYHPLSEQLVTVLRDHTQRNDPLFFRVVIAYYFALAASQMRCAIVMPEGDEIPTNVYALALAPSGFGKTKSTQKLEDGMLGQFRKTFLNQTFPLQADINLQLMADDRALRNGTDPSAEKSLLDKAFNGMGPLLFSFNSGTAAAVKQMRNKLLMANAGSLNLIMDEVGNNLTGNMEVFDTFIELYDKGLIKQKLLKNTKDNARDEEIFDKTPANLLMFGTIAKLFDGAKTEDDLRMMLESGYARRCFFAYIRNSARQKMTAKEMYDARVNKTNSVFMDQLANKLENLADPINVNKKLVIKEETFLLLNEYQLACEVRAEKMPEHFEIQRREMSERNFKVLKLAGAYAFIDDVVEITESHIENAIKLAEDSGEAFNMMLAQDRPYVKLAKYIATVGNDVTQADLAEDLPFYKGSVSHKQDMMNLAVAYGYKNNIVIKKSFIDGIEFMRGEMLKQTDLSKIIVSYSTDFAKDYVNEYAPFDQLHKLTQADNLHWVSHHLVDNYRNEENAIPGFNVVVIDVDGKTTIKAAKQLLGNYKFLLYTTKRHTEESNRFRIVLPINYELKLDAKDYREFMNHIFDWLPFSADEETAQRARKWLTHNHHYEYNDGELLDALPFIPKTSKNEERKKLLNNQQSMDNLERWMINNIGDGNRNNMLYRYAMVLVDSGLDVEGVRQKVMSINNKLNDPLDEAEIMTTVMVSVFREISKR